MKKVIFICTGNTCRSPMAEGIFKSLLTQKNIMDIEASSRGLSVNMGEKVAENAVFALKGMGINIEGHLPKQLELSEALEADLIVALTENHKNILVNAGIPKDKIIALNIPDPYMQDIEVYRKTAKETETLMPKILEIFAPETYIKELSVLDSQAISEVENSALGSEAWSQSAVSETMQKSGRFFGAFIGERLIGTAGVSIILDEAYITNIAVLEGFRRRGFASKLLQKLIDLNEEKALNFITLEVRESNLGAISLYEKFGFTKQGRRKDFYANPKETAIIMTKFFR